MIRFCNAARAENDDYPEYSDDEYPSDEDEKKMEDARIKLIREKYQIPYGVHLMHGCGMRNFEIPIFMKFAKWWVKGEMDEKIFALFTFHFCEIQEVDFYWVLMDQPGFYYDQEWADRNGEPTFTELESELKSIGTRSKKKAKMTFQLNF